MTKYRAPALSRGLQVIELLAASAIPLTMSEIVAAMNLTFNHLYRIIQCLEEEGYLRLDTNGYYHLTEKLTISSRSDFLRQFAKSDICQELMKNFTWKTNQPCHLAGIKDGQVYVIAHQHPQFAPSISAREGALLNTVKSSSALLLLALSSPQESWSLIRSYRLDIRLRTMMFEQMSLITSRGYAEIPHDRIVGLTSVSWPIKSTDGYALASITCPYFDKVPGDFDSVKVDLSILAEEMEKRLADYVATILKR